jgi:hypothetical protein
VSTMRAALGSHFLDEQVRDCDAGGPSSTERAPLRLPLCMSVSEARAALADAGETIALVTNRDAEVGVVTAEDLVLDGPARALIGDVMGREVVSIDPSADLRRTLRTYNEAAWSSAIRRRPGDLPVRWRHNGRHR